MNEEDVSTDPRADDQRIVAELICERVDMMLALIGGRPELAPLIPGLTAAGYSARRVVEGADGGAADL